MIQMFRKLICCAAVLCGCLYGLPAAADAPDISAKGCVLVDAQTGFAVFQQNAQEKLPMASTTKIMTTLLTLESGDLDTPFLADSEAIRVEGSSMGLQEGDTVTRRALCAGMLLPSGNDGANAAAVSVGGSIPQFLAMMNARAKQIGMTHSYFASPSGLDAEGHGASAYDMALLAREALRNPEFAAICCRQTMTVCYGNPPYARTLTNTNKLLGTDDTVIGVKTGFTDAAGRCLVSAARRQERTLICVTLNDRNDWSDHEALYDYGFAGAEDYTPPLPEPLTVQVEGGDVQAVSGYVREAPKLTAWYGKPPECSVTAVLQPFLTAPVQRGDQIGEMIWRCGAVEIARTPVLAAENVQVAQKTTFRSRLVRTISRIRCMFT
ncbi:MAG: D-alanyl-D-alanine carboxypeptidase [Oscillospiraceae bacterium]|nr:D-alanyl-D-alanine carboxypeptidase [Oscillospiraceae bacterium]